MLKETYRLTLENNQMLRSMRRNAFVGSVIKFAIYAALLLVPIWLYLTYVAPMMQDLLNTAQQVQGASADAQARFGDFSSVFDQYRELLAQ